MVWEFNNGRAKHHWLQEGFATYYAVGGTYIYGDDYFYSNYQSHTDKICFRTDSIPVLNTKATR
jgi:aminopeptidase N